MAHPYTTDARVRLFLGTDRVTTLGDRDSSGTIDTGLMDDAIQRVCNRVDGALAGRYVMPCAAITDTTPTPGQVADLVDLGVGAMLYEWLAPTSGDAKTLRDRYEALLSAYRDGSENVVGLTEQSANVGSASVSYESIGTHLAGATDAAGDRTGAWSQDSTTTDQARGI